MTRSEDYDSVIEELGETIVANEVLQSEIESWKYTAARSLKLLNELVYSFQNKKDESTYKNIAKSEALLRELGVYWNSAPGERVLDLDAIIKALPVT